MTVAMAGRVFGKAAKRLSSDGAPGEKNGGLFKEAAVFFVTDDVFREAKDVFCEADKVFYEADDASDEENGVRLVSDGT